MAERFRTSAYGLPIDKFSAIETTKRALGRAALSLVLEHGLHAVSGDAIAAAAGVAPRTFRNYFSNKEEAVLSILETIQNRYVETVMDRDPDEPVLDSLEAAAIELVEATEDREQLAARARLMEQNLARVGQSSRVVGGVTRWR
ncbi:TetR/AcrR family transcriptional regulator [Mycolicibacterium moriokaense]|uniref:TetR family transcriptional regulator n=1 Tax=Mycolicibacterium moriokaense TaxID=39691 RepID=A0A318H236_9MYCO|nr:TetR family transcriptional regulator [Mycolicibacterium moriokaense]PXW97399.1 TetR family transcriptional regulator [Mycolicibacterium moriokaense]